MSSAACGNSACAALPLTSRGLSSLIAQFVPANGDFLSFWGGVGWGGGGAFQEQQLIPLPSATQGRLNFTVPSFIVATFPTLCSPILSASIMVGASVPVPFSDSSLVASLPSGLLLQQPFIVGPSFSPILAKTDSQIVAGKYVDL